MLRNLQQATWAREANGERIASSLLGTRPGTLLADVLFNIAVTSSMTQIQEEFEMWGLKTSIHVGPAQDAVPFPTVAWMDDLAICIEGASEAHLLSNVKHACCIVESDFLNVGLSLNMSANKTEAAVHFAGGGARAAGKRLHVDGDSTLSVQRADGTAFPLRIVPAYKHLGILLDPDGSIIPEVRQRIALAGSALHQLRRSVLRKTLSVSARVTILEAVVFSRLLYGCQTWPVLSFRTFKQINCFYMKAIQLSFGDATMPNEELLAAANLPGLLCQLAGVAFQAPRRDSGDAAQCERAHSCSEYGCRAVSSPVGQTSHPF